MKELRPAALGTEAYNWRRSRLQPDPKGLESAFQTAKQKQVRRDYDDRQSSRFSAERKRMVRARQQPPVAGYLLPDGVCG